MSTYENMMSDQVVLSDAVNESASSDVRILRQGAVLETDGQQPKGIEADAEALSLPTGFLNSDTQEAMQLQSEAVESVGDGRYQSEIVFLPDDRIRITATTQWPWTVQGHIRMRFPNGKSYIGSGTMVNRHHVLTAGHCIYSRDDGGWATSVSFEPARNGNERPFGTHFATRLLSVRGWTDQAKSDYDVGMLVLSNDVGAQTGWNGIITGPDAILNQYRVNVTGFPGDKGGQQMWTHADAISAVASERFYYRIDTYGGQSGSGVWSTWDGHSGNKVCGIHTTGSPSGNGATRISRPKFDRIVDWMSSY